MQAGLPLGGADAQLALEEGVKGAVLGVDGAEHAAQQLRAQLDGAAEAVGLRVELRGDGLKRAVGRGLEEDVGGRKGAEGGRVRVAVAVAVGRSARLEVAVGGDVVGLDEGVGRAEGLEQQGDGDAGAVAAAGAVHEEARGGRQGEQGGEERAVAAQLAGGLVARAVGGDEGEHAVVGPVAGDEGDAARVEEQGRGQAGGADEGGEGVAVDGGVDGGVGVGVGVDGGGVGVDGLGPVAGPAAAAAAAAAADDGRHGNGGVGVGGAGRQAVRVAARLGGPAEVDDGVDAEALQRRHAAGRQLRERGAAEDAPGHDAPAAGHGVAAEVARVERALEGDDGVDGGDGRCRRRRRRCARCARFSRCADVGVARHCCVDELEWPGQAKYLVS
ncbi:hypothetical protein O9K51_07308 [Purpureocillium lavendulum]|uniref:Uncharacterized protein n=1 Tax=Purpureocillium lavendulum TaxID=1247861 RepID=A0AB34FIX5_9HYPO|nr:hypothetical protein O9K51_07308 [Purpureocillium lavendulum]